MELFNVTKFVPGKVAHAIKELLMGADFIVLYNFDTNKFGFMTNNKVDNKTNELVNKLLYRSKLGDVLIQDLIQHPVDVEKLLLMKNNGVDVVKMLMNV